ncbi:unnamed protein product [Allacma fusca]|uniref:Uncharacterized protein n=1 Tax=Allacma fusca TaxID=39272 RepID=A0A8J2M387_9HEXA|nr:unnamed protein product [Allacma fusca]
MYCDINSGPQTVPVIRMNLLSVIVAYLVIIVGSINAVKLVPGRILPPQVQQENVRYARSPIGLEHARTLGQFPASQSVRLVRKALAGHDGEHHGTGCHGDGGVTTLRKNGGMLGELGGKGCHKVRGPTTLVGIGQMLGGLLRKDDGLLTV